MKITVRTILLVMLSVVASLVISVKMTRDVRACRLPIGEWEIFFFDAEGNRIGEVAVELVSPDLAVYERFDDGRLKRICKFSPFDNFLLDNKVSTEAGSITLVNTRELITFASSYRLLWLVKMGKSEMADVRLEVSSDNYETVLIDYEYICSSGKSLTVTLQHSSL